MKTLVAALALVVLGSLTSAGPARAQAPEAAISVAADGKRKINLAGRQRMLTQLLAKATCFISLGVDDKAQANVMWTTHDIFEEVLVALRKGNAELRMLPEQDPQILAALDTIAKHWMSYGRAVQQGDLPAVIEQNIVLLNAINDSVTLFEKRYGAAGKVPPEIAAAINIAGRQRMLSQKASKELCLIAAGSDVAGNRASLVATMDLFERSLRALRDGEATMGLRPAPNDAIRGLIKTGEAEWAKLKAVLARVAQGGTAGVSEVASVASLNMPVLEAMEDIVEAYEEVGG